MTQYAEIIVISNTIRLETVTGSQQLAKKYNLVELNEGVQLRGDDALAHLQEIINNFYVPLGQMSLFNQVMLLAMSRKSTMQMSESTFNEDFGLYVTLRG